MLDALRKGASGWLAQLFIALLVVSFAIWGVSDIFSGFRSDSVATVGGTDISVQSFQRQYDTATRALSQQLGQPVTSEQAQMFGVPGQVLGRLIADATLNDEATTLSLGISSATLAQQIADDPSFKDASGNFDRNAFGQILRSAGMTEDQYLDQLRESYVRQQIADGLVGATEVPDAYLRAMHEFRGEERAISYLVLVPALVTTVGEPGDADLTAYFTANKVQWRAPEFRGLKVMRMAPADLANTGEISDEDARKAYDGVVATRYTTAEKRTVQQIVFKDKADADTAAASLASGKTFDELIVARKLKPEDVDIGLVTREAILDPKVAEIAFGLAQNSVSPVFDGRFGPVIVRVTTVEPQVVRTFDEVKADLKKELAEQRAAAEIADQLDVIEDSRAGGETLEGVAAKYGLKILTVPAVDKAGKDDKGNAIADLPGGTPLVTAAFESDVGNQNDPIAINPGYVWFDVTAVTAERDRDLAEVRDQVAAAWKKDELEKKLTETANAARDRLAKGEDIAKVATDLGVTAKTADKVTRATVASDDLSAAAILSAFGGPKGYAAVGAGAAADSKVVLVVTDVTTPVYVSGTPDMAATKEQLSGQMSNDLLQQYVAQLQDRMGVRVNQTLLQQALGAPAIPGT